MGGRGEEIAGESQVIAEPLRSIKQSEGQRKEQCAGKYRVVQEGLS
jgi:hypothetical protein